MAELKFEFDGDAFSAPFDMPEYPEISDGYLPPNVHIHVDYGRHERRDDLAPTIPKFDACDIYIPEAAGYDEDWVRTTRRLARGDARLMKRLQGLSLYDPDTFEAAELDLMFGSEKPMLFVDGNAGQTTNAYQDDEIVEIAKASGFASFNEAIAYMFKLDFDTTRDEVNRDRIMLENLGPKIGRLIAMMPRLQVKDEVLVLMRLGTAHYRVFDHLSKSPASRDQVSAETVNYRTQVAIVNRTEEDLTSRIIENQKVPRQLIIEHTIVNGIHQIFPVTATDPDELTRQIAIKNTLTKNIIASGAEVAALIIGRIGNNCAQLGDHEFLQKHYSEAQSSDHE